MDTLLSLTQLVLTSIVFLCVITYVTAHIIMGNINSFPGYLASFIFLYLTWVLVRLSWKEYIKERNK